MKGIYSDQTLRYLIPEEPNVGDPVKIRLRVPKYIGNVLGNVYISPEKNSKSYSHSKMTIEYETENFFYFVSSFVMPSRIINYHFELEIINENKKIKYDSMGIVINRHIEDFTLIAGFRTPEWSHGSVYYQIFVDRFYNGDRSNDPVDGEYNYDSTPIIKKSWDELPSQETGHKEFYGGDLKGVLDKIDYLKELGIETVYFNPVFVSPSPHKYDTQDYEHIDPHIGVIKNDTDDINFKYKIRTTDKENLELSDRLFGELTSKFSKENIRVVLDGVFNHCGSFHKWVDELGIYENQGVIQNPESDSREYFYWNNGYYEGWWGYPTLPKLNYESTKLWNYIAGIGKKWVSEPYNISGWRLDVADDLGKSFDMNKNFWKYFKKEFKSVNPETVVFAEIYKSPKPWLENKSWDSVMNYIGCMDPVGYFLTGMEKHSDAFNSDLFMNSDIFVNTVMWALSQLPMNSKFIALNQLSNHDHSRWMTRTNMKTGRINSSGHYGAEENTDISVFKMGLIMMFTLPGSPGFYYGDEIGLTGWTDPDNRRPYPWDKYNDINKELLSFSKSLVDIYKHHKVMRKSSFMFLNWDGGYVSYALWDNEEKIVVIHNREESSKQVKIPLWLTEENSGFLKLIFSNNNSEKVNLNFEKGIFNFNLSPKSSYVFEINPK
ncbi:MAG: glycoside hydrolase family 13 protein [Thermotogae bacterium]|nr:glycoside hydrolase family 13 protein [Thermotogota bacterium]